MSSDASARAALRRRAGGMFKSGATQADVARALGVSRQTASRWYAKWASGGARAIEAEAVGGRRPRLSDEDFARVGRALRQGPRAHGFPDERWTCRQVALVIARLTGVSYHPSHVCRLIHRRGWPLTPPY
jgi:transposase